MPEYETLFAFGSMLGNANAPSIIHANILCDLLGLDSISMGVTLAFVAECLEKGLLTAGRRRRILRLVGSRGNDPPARADRAPRGIR